MGVWGYSLLVVRLIASTSRDTPEAPPDEPPSVMLTGAPCPGAPDIIDAVGEHAPAEVSPGWLAQWEVELNREPDGSWSAALRLRDATDAPARSFRGSTCAEVLDAAALSLALAATDAEGTPDADAGPVPAVTLPELPAVTSPSSAATRMTTPRHADAAPSPRVDRDTRTRPHRLTLAGGLVTSVPRVAAELAVGYAWAPRRFALEIAAAYDTPRFVPYPPAPRAGGLVQRAVLRVAACPSMTRRSVRWGGCAVTEAATIVARGRGIERPRTVWLPHVTVGLGGRLAWAMSSRVELRVELDGFVAVVRPAAHLGAREPFLRPPRFGGRALLGLGFTLPGPRRRSGPA